MSLCVEVVTACKHNVTYRWGAGSTDNTSLRCWFISIQNKVCSPSDGSGLSIHWHEALGAPLKSWHYRPWVRSLLVGGDTLAYGRAQMWAGSEICWYDLRPFNLFSFHLFVGDMREKNETRITIEGVESHIMKQLIEYTYTSDIHITPENAQQLLSAANMIQIISIIDACCRWEFTLHMQCIKTCPLQLLLWKVTWHFYPNFNFIHYILHPFWTASCLLIFSGRKWQV